MRRRIFLDALSGAWIAAVSTGSRAVAVAADVDGIVIRGTWRAHVMLGAARLTLAGTDAALEGVSIARDKTTLTIASNAHESGPPLELHATLAQLRGVATSGNVLLTLEDESNAPLFLDLAGAGTARAMGSVPLLRVTTSGTVSADLSALIASTVRVHARQASRLAVRTLNELTIVALGTARVTYEEGTSRPKLTVRDAASVERL